MTNEQLGAGVMFERIRRITGYLTGDTSTWNDAKKAELRDRIPHGTANEASRKEAEN